MQLRVSIAIFFTSLKAFEEFSYNKILKSILFFNFLRDLVIPNFWPEYQIYFFK